MSRSQSCPAGAPVDRRAFLAGAAALAVLPVRVLAAPAAPTAAPVPAVRSLSPAFDRIVAPGSMPTVIATDIRWAEGPVWVPQGGYLLFSDPPANIVRRWRPGGRAETSLDPSGAAGTDPAAVREPGANGLALDRTGALLIANSGGRSIDRVDLKTGRRTVAVATYRGKKFNSPNDLAVARDGAIWFTDPPYGLTQGDSSPLKELPHNGVYRAGPDGRVTLAVADLTFPNGIALSPDERRLYVSVSDPAAPRIMVYDLDPAGGVVRGRVLLDAKPMMAPDAPGLPDGMKVARDGTLFCSVPGGLMVMTPEAKPLGLIASGDGPIANCCFGEAGRVLYMTANHRVLRLPLARAMG